MRVFDEAVDRVIYEARDDYPSPLSAQERECRECGLRESENDGGVKGLQLQVCSGCKMTIYCVGHIHWHTADHGPD